MAATLPTVFDERELEEQFRPERKNFEDLLRELQAIRPADIKADLMGKAAAQFAAEIDTKAKAALNTIDEKTGPIDESINGLVRRWRSFLGELKAPFLNARALTRGISSQYQLVLDYQQKEQQRRLEALQREAAERERAEEVARMQALAAKQGAEAAKFGGVGPEAAEAEAEAARLALEAQEAARRPVVPAAVPMAAVSQGKVEGMSGNKVFLRTIRNALEAAKFLAWSSHQPAGISIPKEKRNVVILMFAGVEVTINFAGKRKSNEAIPGVDVTETIDPSNRRK